LTEVQLDFKYKKHIIVVGLRSDLACERVVEYKEGERVAEALRAPFIECSSKEDINIEAVFDLVLT